MLERPKVFKKTGNNPGMGSRLRQELNERSWAQPIGAYTDDLYEFDQRLAAKRKKERDLATYDIDKPVIPEEQEEALKTPVNASEEPSTDTKPITTETPVEEPKETPKDEETESSDLAEIALNTIGGLTRGGVAGAAVEGITTTAAKVTNALNELPAGYSMWDYTKDAIATWINNRELGKISTVRYDIGLDLTPKKEALQSEIDYVKLEAQYDQLVKAAREADDKDRPALVEQYNQVRQQLIEGLDGYRNAVAQRIAGVDYDPEAEGTDVHNYLNRTKEERLSLNAEDMYKIDQKLATSYTELNELKKSLREREAGTSKLFAGKLPLIGDFEIPGFNHKVSDTFTESEKNTPLELTNVDSWLWRVPGLAGSSAALMEYQVAGLAGMYSAQLAKTAILRGTTRLTRNAPLIGVAEFAGGVVAAGGVAAQVGSTFMSRERESAMEMMSNYDDYIRSKAQETGIDLNKIVAEGRQYIDAVKPEIPGLDLTESLTDDEVLEMMNTGTIPSTDKKYNNLRAAGRQDLDNLFYQNMALGVVDLGQQMMMFPVAGKLMKTVAKPVTTSLSKIPAAVSAKLNKGIDNVIEYGAKQMPKLIKDGKNIRAFGKHILGGAARLAGVGISEAYEEGIQYVQGKRYVEGYYKDRPANLGTALWDNAVAIADITGAVVGSTSVGSMLGIGDPLLMNDTELMESMHGGAMLGMGMGAGAQALNTAVSATSVGQSLGLGGQSDILNYIDQLKANSFVRNLTADHYKSKEDFVKMQMYADAAIANKAEAVITSLEQSKKSLPAGIEEADIDAEIAVAKDAFRIAGAQSTQQLAKALGIKPKSDAFKDLVATAAYTQQRNRDEWTRFNMAERLYGGMYNDAEFNEFVDRQLGKDVDPSVKEFYKQMIVHKTEQAALQDLMNEIDTNTELAKTVADKFGINLGMNLENVDSLKGFLNDMFKQSQKQSMAYELQLLEGKANFNLSEVDAYISPRTETNNPTLTYQNLLLSAYTSTQADKVARAFTGTILKDGTINRLKYLEPKLQTRTDGEIIDTVRNYLAKVNEVRDAVAKDAELIANSFKDENTVTDPVTEPTPVIPDGPVEEAPTTPTDTPPVPPTTPTTPVETIDQLPPPDRAPEIGTGFSETTPSPESTEQPTTDQTTEDEINKILAQARVEDEATEDGTVDLPTELDAAPESLADAVNEAKKPIEPTETDKTKEEADKAAEQEEAKQTQEQLPPPDESTDVTVSDEDLIKTNKMARLEDASSEGINKGVANGSLTESIMDRGESVDRSAISHTAFYDPLATTPMGDKYEPGIKLSALLSDPDSKQYLTYEYIVTDYQGHEDKAIILEITDSRDGKVYAAALRTPGTARMAMFRLGKYTEEQIDAEIMALTNFRNTILSLWENAQKINAKVIPTSITFSNGDFNVNRTEDGLVINRPIKDVKGFKIPDDPYAIDNGTVELGYGTGAVGEFRVTGYEGKLMPGQGGSGTIYLYTSNTPNGNKRQVKLNKRKFSHDPAVVDLIFDLFVKNRANNDYIYVNFNGRQATTSISNKELLDFMFRWGPRTVMTDKKQRELVPHNIPKQANYDSKTDTYQLGDEFYRRDDLLSNEALAAKFKEQLARDFVWSFDKDILWDKIGDKLGNIKGYFYGTGAEKLVFIPGLLEFTAEDVGLVKDEDGNYEDDDNHPGGISFLNWYAKNGVLQSDLQDQPFKAPFIYTNSVGLSEPDAKLIGTPTAPATEAKTTKVKPVTKKGFNVTSVANTKAGRIEIEVTAPNGDARLIVYDPNGERQIDVLDYFSADGGYVQGRKLTDQQISKLLEQVFLKKYRDLLFKGEADIHKILDALQNAGVSIGTEPLSLVEESADEPSVDDILAKATTGETTEETTPEQQMLTPEEEEALFNEMDRFNGIAMKTDNNDTIAKQNRKQKTIDVDKARTWLNEKLGLTNEDVIVTENVIKVAGAGITAMGLTRADAIMLWQGAIEGTQYHEAFHRVNLLLHTPEERAKIYAARRKTLKKDVTNEELEELLAEGFREWMSSKTKRFGYAITKAFYKMFNFIDAVRNLQNNDIREIYNRIRKGDYVNVPVDAISRRQFLEMYSAGAPFNYGTADKPISLRTIPTVRDFYDVVDTLKAQLFQTNSIKTLQDLLDITKDGAEAPFAKLRGKIEMFSRSTRLTVEQRAVLAEVLEHFDTLFAPELTASLRAMGIREIDAKAEDNMTANESDTVRGGEIAAYDKKAIEVSKKKNALLASKLFMATMVESTFAFENDVKVTKAVINPLTGLNKFVDFDTSWNIILNNLSEVSSFEELIETSARLAESNPFFAVFHRRLTNGTVEENLATQLLVTIQSHNQEMLYLGYESVANEEGKTIGTAFRVGDSNTLRAKKMYPTLWGHNFVNNTGIVSMANNKIEINNNRIDKIIQGYNDIVAKAQDNLTSNDLQLAQNLKVRVVNMLNAVGIDVDIDILEHFMNETREVKGATDIEKLHTMLTQTRANSLYNTIIGNLKRIRSTGRIEYTNKAGKVMVKPLEDIFLQESFTSSLAVSYATVNPRPEEMNVLGPDGNLLYTKTQNNYLSDMVKWLTNGKNKALLNNLLSVPYNKSSKLLNAIKNGAQVKLHNFVNFTELSAGDKGRDYTSISPLENYLSKMTLLRNNLMTLPTMADKATYYVISGVELFHKRLTFFKNEGKQTLMLDNAILQQFVKYANDEWRAIKKYYDPETLALLEKDPQRKVKNYHSLKKGGRFRHFTEVYMLNSEGVVEKTNLNALLDQAEKDGNIQTAMDLIDNEFFKKDNLFKMQAVNQLLKQAIAAELETLANLGMITLNKADTSAIPTMSNLLLDVETYNELVASYSASTDPALSGRATTMAIYDMVADMTVNHLVSLHEFEKVFAKDSAYYEDTNDGIKRAGGLLSTGDNLRIFKKTHYNTATLADNNVISKQKDELGKAFLRSYLHNTMIQLGEATEADIHEKIDNPSEVALQIATAKAKTANEGYGNGRINQADAQVMISPEMYEAIVRGLGEWTPEVAEAFAIMENDLDWLSNPDKYAKAIKALMKPLKMTSFNDIFDMELGLDVPVFDKMALFPMFKVIATGDNKQLYERMTATGEFKGMTKIDMVKFESAVKVGIRTKTAPYLDKTSTTPGDFKSLQVYPQEMKYLRRQLLTDPHKEEVHKVGTQVAKAALGNIVSNRLYGTNRPGKTPILGRDLITEVMSAINQLSDRGKTNILKQLGNIVDGLFIPDIKKLSSMLQKDAKASGLPADVIDALSIVNGTFKIPLSALSDDNWVASRFIAEVGRNTVDINLPGGAFIQMSSFGMSSVTAVGANSYNGGKELSFRNADGSMDAIISMTMLKHIVPKTHQKSHAMMKQWLLDNNIIGENSTPMAMGYRIPTQGLSSISALRIVDVLPENIGDTVVLPSEFTKLTGSDFDIDKLYLTRYNYDQNGKKIEFNETPTSEETWQRKEASLERRGFTKDQITEEYLKWIGRNKGKDKWAINSKAAVENRLLDMYLTILTDDTNVNETRVPLDNSTDYLKYVVLKRVDGNAKEVAKSPYYFLSPTYHMNKFFEYMGGKTGLAPFALNNVHHVLTQITNLRLKPNAILDNFGIGRLDLIDSFDKNKTNILEWFSAMISAHVDVAKDPYVIRLGINQWTYNMTNFLLRTGIGENTFYFLPQQILKDMSERIASTRGRYGVDKFKSSSKLEREAIKEVYNRYRRLAENEIAKEKDPAYKRSLDNKLKQLDKTNDDGTLEVRNDQVLLEESYLLKQLDKRNSGKLDFDYYYNQLLIYKTFEQLQPYAQGLSELVHVSQVDTKKYGNNFMLINSFLHRVKDNLINNKVFYGKDLRRFFTETFLDKKIRNSILFVQDLFKGVVIQATPKFTDMYDQLMSQLGKLGTKDERLINTVANSIEAGIKSEFFAKKLRQLGIPVNSMFYGDNTMSKQLSQLKTDILSGKYPELLSEYGKIKNEFLNFITPRPGDVKFDGYDSPDYITTNAISLDDNNIKDRMKNYWQELLDSKYPEVRTFAERLVLYAFVTTGDNSVMHGFFNMVPLEYKKTLGYTDFINRKLSELNDDTFNLDSTELLQDALLNNYHDGNMVPDVKFTRRYQKKDGSWGSDTLDHLMSKTPLVDGTPYPLIIMNKRVMPTGVNAQKDPLYPPYVKYNIDQTKNPATTVVYKYIGFTQVDSKNGDADYVPVYIAVNKKGFKADGKTITEYGQGFYSNYYFNNTPNSHLVLQLNQNNFTDLVMAESVFANPALESNARQMLDAIKLVTNFHSDNVALNATYEDVMNGSTLVETIINAPTLGTEQQRSLADISDDLVNATKTQQPATSILPTVERLDGIITRDWVQSHPKTLFLFGDNDIRKGLGGQAKEMRGEPNTIGISTKKLPSNKENAFKTDDEFEANKAIIDQDIQNVIDEFNTGKYDKIVIPTIGVGLAKLPEKAPLTYAYLQTKFDELADIISNQSPQSSQPAALYTDSLNDDNGSPIIVHRGYAMTEDREASSILETLPQEGQSQATDYVTAGIHFSTDEAAAQSYANLKSDKTPIGNEKINRAYRGDYGKVSSYTVVGNHIYRFDTTRAAEEAIKNGEIDDWDVIFIKKDSTPFSKGSEVIVRNADQVTPVTTTEAPGITRDDEINDAITDKKEAPEIIQFNSQLDNSYKVLSNFANSPIVYNEISYPTVEHAFQAQKTTNVAIQNNVFGSNAVQPLTAAQARKAGKTVQLRNDWELVKEPIMKELLIAKFEDNALREILLSTGNIELQHLSDWDTHWGVNSDGVGQNILGKLLMEVRDYYRNSASTVKVPTSTPQLVATRNKYVNMLDNHVIEFGVGNIKHEFNLQDVGINFTPNAQQVTALDNIFEWSLTSIMDPDKAAYTLEGYAGTGKSSIMKIVAEIVGENFNIVPAAPTHQAKDVLTNYIGIEASTVHSILGLSPNFDIENFKLDQLQFVRTSGGIFEGIQHQSLFIIDEASMLNDDMVKHLTKVIHEQGHKVLFVGDPKQINPVGQETISYAFTGYKKSVLTTIERQRGGNPLIDKASRIREDQDSAVKVTRYYDPEFTEFGKGYVVSRTGNPEDKAAIGKFIRDTFTSEEFQENPMLIRMVAWTNAKVAELNNGVRKSVLGYTDALENGEILKTYDTMGNIANSTELKVLSIEKGLEIDLRQLFKQAMDVSNLPEVVVKYDRVEMARISDLEETLAGELKPTSRIVISDPTMQGEISRFYTAVYQTFEDKLDDLYMQYREGRITERQYNYGLYETNKAKAELTGILATMYPISGDLQLGRVISKAEVRRNPRWMQGPPMVRKVDSRVLKKKTLDYGYASTVHKAQGSTYKYVVVHSDDIQRNPNFTERMRIMYTAVTRASDAAIVQSAQNISDNEMSASKFVEKIDNVKKNYSSETKNKCRNK